MCSIIASNSDDDAIIPEHIKAILLQGLILHHSQIMPSYCI